MMMRRPRVNALHYSVRKLLGAEIDMHRYVEVRQWNRENAVKFGTAQ